MVIIKKKTLVFQIHPENSKYKIAVSMQSLSAHARFYDTALADVANEKNQTWQK